MALAHGVSGQVTEGARRLRREHCLTNPGILAGNARTHELGPEADRGRREKVSGSPGDRRLEDVVAYPRPPAAGSAPTASGAPR
jgi:hypothetical protein